jgi:acetyl-CoA/propionyl-CoA carboxylase carboxyl transferase subunit
MTTAAADRPAAGSGDRQAEHPAARLHRLLDSDSVQPLFPPDHGDVWVVRGEITGQPVIAFCTDATTMGGALGAEGCARIAAGIDTAVKLGRPVIGLWHSGGARLGEGVAALDGVGRVFAAMIRASGRVPQISVVLGPAAGGAAYGPALTDVVVMAPAARVFVTGPEVVRSVTGEQVDMETLGGPALHARESGVAHVVARDEADALLRARRIVRLLARPGGLDLAGVRDEPVRDPSALLPSRTRAAYDVRPLIDALLDQAPREGSGVGGSFEELQPRWAPNVVTGLGRLAERTVGVLANNPLRKGGCLDSTAAEKAARFVRMCDAFGIPLLVLVDVPGYLPGIDQERGGVVRRGAKLLHAFAEAVVPRVTLVLRKAYGGAYIAMNSRALGATAVFAWPGAEVAVMAADAAVGVLHRRVLSGSPEGQRDALRTRLVAEHEREAGGVARAVDLGVVDEVVAPEHTRLRVAEAFARAAHQQGRHGNIPL